MSARSVVKLVLLAEAFAVTTFGLGWWSVPLVAAIWAAVSRSPRRAEIAALCATGGWASLLLLDIVKGPVATMATQLGSVMSLPPAVLYLLTLLFPALLAWSAASLIPAFRHTLSAVSSP
jgi:hypothetical protein